MRESCKKGMIWLESAIDATGGQGVSIRYKMFTGWQKPYPETTGYIIQTFFDYANVSNEGRYYAKAVQIADWLLSSQSDDGSIQGGPSGSQLGPLAFDTGQALFGLVRAYQETWDCKFKIGALRAGNWLTAVQEKDGSWVKFSYHSIPHTYYSRVAWALAELHRINNNEKYLKAAERNIRWVIKNQKNNGWFRNCGFTEKNHNAPYTHTIAYTIRGILECADYAKDSSFLEAAAKSLESLLSLMQPTGYLYGQYDENWRHVGSYSCMTGNCQISILFMRLYQIVRDPRYYQAAKIINRFIQAKQSQGFFGRASFGAIPGSNPIWGPYERLSYPSWGTKFFVDALLLEETLEK